LTKPLSRMRIPNNKSRQSKRFINRRRRTVVVVVILVLVSIGSWTWTISRLTDLAFLTIRNIEITADPDISIVIDQTVKRSLEGQYLGLFSRSNTLIYPRLSLIDEIKSADPRIESVLIKRKGLNALAVFVTEKIPAAIVCAGLPDEINTQFIISKYLGSCYWADKNGFVYEKTSSKYGTKYNKYFIPDLDVLVGDSIQAMFATSTDEFLLLQSFYDEIRENNIDVQAILMKENREYELYILNPDHGAVSDDKSMAVVYFNTSHSLPKQASNLISFWNSMTADARARGETVSFEHIDIRYGSNVSYKRN